MPTDQPNNAADLPVEPRDADTAVAVLDEGGMGEIPGGGEPGRSAGDPLAGSAPGGGGTSPNAPIDTGVDAGDAAASSEARALAADEPEAHPS